MDGVKVLIFLILSFPLYYAANQCPNFNCYNNTFPIRFPFRLPSLQPKNCGSPGFTVGCNNQGISVLNLTASGEFLIRNINYRKRVLQLYDPDECLPRRLLKLNLSGSPFKAIHHQNYTFLSCPSNYTRSGFTTITCLGNSTTTTLATTSLSLATSLTRCKIQQTLRIPVLLTAQRDSSFSSDISKDLQLTWTIPECQDCEETGGVCAFDSIGQMAGCSSHYTYTGPTIERKKGGSIIKIIALCIAIPAVATSLGICTVMCVTGRRRVMGPNNTQNNSTTAPTTAEVEILTPGLDETTIESYVKVIVGESRRIPGPNSVTCPICLSDYQAQDIVRYIPQCQHCFHSHCVDEWLRLKGSCPICRTSPSPATTLLSTS